MRGCNNYTCLGEVFEIEGIEQVQNRSSLSESSKGRSLSLPVSLSLSDSQRVKRLPEQSSFCFGFDAQLVYMFCYSLTWTVATTELEQN